MYTKLNIDVFGQITCTYFSILKIKKNYLLFFAEQRPVNNLYFAPVSDNFIVPELLSSEIQCSILRCSLSCLRDIRCYYIHYNEANDGCSPCYMYSNYETFSQSYNTLELYKVNNG